MQLRHRCATAAFLICAVAPAGARAQTPAAPPSAAVSPGLVAGACEVVVTLSRAPASDTYVQVAINNNPLGGVSAAGRTTVRVALKGPLAEGDAVRARASTAAAPAAEWSDPVQVAGSARPPDCQDRVAGSAGDSRDPLIVSGFVGFAFDNFAPGSVGGYEEVDGGVPSLHTRPVTGLDFEFRVIGSQDSTRQLWIYGEALYGVRSADIVCTRDESPDLPPVCGNNLAVDVTKRALYIMERATSMEAFLGARLELLTLQAGTSSPTKLYLDAQHGTMMLSGDVKYKNLSVEAHRAYRAHHVGAGLQVVDGAFQGSYLELGLGLTDLFNVPSRGPGAADRTLAYGTTGWGRLKVDAGLIFPMAVPFTQKVWNSGPRVFVEIFSDLDPRRRAPDSLQTFVGLDFDVHDLFKW
ncbi:MAG: hypothetical protein HY824_11780 [Acidobacteria bacterium]|nr:hypothetical protein [Acidobacteriota bacterium]